MLKIFKEQMQKIDVPYEFMRWTSNVQYPYWIGEYSDTPTDSEDGYEEGTLMLTGTTTGSWLELIEQKDKIKNHFPTVYGLRLSTDIGAVVFYYENSFPVDTGTADLKRIQVNLKVKQWKGMN